MIHDVYRDGRIHVCRNLCTTCIFRPGNLMSLRSGRVRGMIDEAVQGDGCIPCHSTLYHGDGNAVCRGFFDRHPTGPLQIADRLGLIEFIDPPSIHERT